jgi:hypothetical protein
MKRGFAAAICVVAMMSLGASGALAGEVTGNGTLKEMHANSPCAFSGQEDLQYFTNDSDTTAKNPFTKGDPAHSQTFGHVKRDSGYTGGANSVPEWEWGCNGHVYGMK